jgi:hypothetical protein
VAALGHTPRTSRRSGTLPARAASPAEIKVSPPLARHDAHSLRQPLPSYLIATHSSGAPFGCDGFRGRREEVGRAREGGHDVSRLRRARARRAAQDEFERARAGLANRRLRGSNVRDSTTREQRADLRDGGEKGKGEVAAAQTSPAQRSELMKPRSARENRAIFDQQHPYAAHIIYTAMDRCWSSIAQ